MGCAVLGACVASVGHLQAQLPPIPAGATAVAQGLYGPRGLKVGPDGNLYVATSGTVTSNTTPTCSAVPGGPFFGGANASILKIDPQGNVSTLATGFPSTFNVPTQSGFGVGDVAFLDGELYAVTAGGGCGHGNPTQPNMVAKVNLATGKWTMIADMSAAVAAHPAANVDPEDFQPDGDFYSLIAARGKLYTVEPNHGQVWSVTKKGDVEMVTDISKLEGHIVPTALVDRQGGLLVSNLGTFPIALDASPLLTLRPGCGDGSGYAVEDCGPGTLHIASSSLPGLTTVVGMDWGPDGLLYLLELSDAAGFPTPGNGKVVRVRNGVAQDVITGLSVPTAMTFGPDGALYVSNWGAAAAPIGQILRFNLH
jgi:sugar lactone lactonase YvrE